MCIRDSHGTARDGRREYDPAGRPDAGEPSGNRGSGHDAERDEPEAETVKALGEPEGVDQDERRRRDEDMSLIHI